MNETRNSSAIERIKALSTRAKKSGGIGSKRVGLADNQKDYIQKIRDEVDARLMKKAT